MYKAQQREQAFIHNWNLLVIRKVPKMQSQIRLCSKLQLKHFKISITNWQTPFMEISFSKVRRCWIISIVMSRPDLTAKLIRFSTQLFITHSRIPTQVDFKKSSRIKSLTIRSKAWIINMSLPIIQGSKAWTKPKMMKFISWSNLHLRGLQWIPNKIKVLATAWLSATLIIKVINKWNNNNKRVKEADPTIKSNRK